MKKKLALMGMVLGMGAIAAQAAINVQLTASSGFYQEDDTTEMLATGNSWLQIIFVQPGFTPSQATPGGGISANESILAEFALVDGGNSDLYGTFVYDLVVPEPFAPYAGGSWYARVFEGGTDPKGNIVAGMWYYESPVFATNDNDTPDSPDVVSIQGANPSSAFAGADFANRPVVPEPATIAFLGLGGLVLAIRRRFVA